jgi:hypothetical protein
MPQRIERPELRRGNLPNHTERRLVPNAIIRGSTMTAAGHHRRHWEEFVERVSSNRSMSLIGWLWQRPPRLVAALLVFVLGVAACSLVGCSKGSGLRQGIADASVDLFPPCQCATPDGADSMAVDSAVQSDGAASLDTAGALYCHDLWEKLGVSKVLVVPIHCGCLDIVMQQGELLRGGTRYWDRLLSYSAGTSQCSITVCCPDQPRA